MEEKFIGYLQYNVDLPVWKGPLDLLLDLIRASKVKIRDIPIKEITSQYLYMLSLMKKIDTNLSADFLVMAATLILIKSRILITEEIGENEQDFETPKKELIEKLLLYEQFKKASQKLLKQEINSTHYLISKEKTRRKNIYKYLNNPSSQLGIAWDKISLKELLLSYLKIENNMNNQISVLGKNYYSLTKKMDWIKNQIKKFTRIKFTDLFSKKKIPRSEIMVTFFGILELYKSSVIKITQEKKFSDIFLSNK
jgi:segregation and condensation protein A